MKPVRLALIGGSGVYHPSLLVETSLRTVGTPYGAVAVTVGRLPDGGEEVAFIPRHGVGHTVPPHRVNYRANVWALKELGVERVLATAAVGSLRPALAPGDVVVCDQFLDFTRGRPSTFFEGGERGVAHVDVTEPYCPVLRAVLVEAAEAEGVRVHGSGTYVCTEGPRFETAAEIRLFASLGGDVVGMTGVPEVVLARELALCYATVAAVTNLAAGLSPTPLTHSEVMAVMAANAERLRRVLARALAAVPVLRDCSCAV
ncbi:MAG: S-methyl-5'-thioadenosine phosphorylase, partial [Clostridia bacterium]|nr:S-methyl-5'-thioadenosine phosphorylase [Clostridia bacterium]